MSQMLQKNSLKNTELELHQNYKEYSNAVSDVVEAYYSHSLRAKPDNFDKIVLHWTNLLIKCGIPASQLMDLYLESHLNLKRGEYFNIDTIIATWNDGIDQRLQEIKSKEICSICKGTNETQKYDFKLREDVMVPCPKCI